MVIVTKENEMNDLIDRQDAIRDIRSMDVCVIYDDMCSTEEAVEKAIVATKRTAIFGLERMPSAEPEQSIAEWQKDFREYINMLNMPRDDYKGIMAYIDEVPSVEPERKKGEWLELTNTNHSYVCSVCGRMLVNITDGKNKVTKSYPFCHCGVDMRGNSE